jgi:hypothetical protein
LRGEDENVVLTFIEKLVDHFEILKDSLHVKHKDETLSFGLKLRFFDVNEKLLNDIELKSNLQKEFHEKLEEENFPQKKLCKEKE